MIFSTVEYILFFAVVFPLYWRTAGILRNVVLLIASYFFYMSWMPIYGVLIFLMTLVNYVLGLLIEKHRDNRLLFAFSIVINVLTLVYYKYTNFLVSSLFDFLRQLSIYVPHISVAPTNPVYDIILPLGISFFTFEFIHYLVDIKRGSPALRKPIDFALFTAFFPSQIAGPIKRYLQFEKELNAPKVFNKSDVLEGCALFVQGLFKKVALADNLSIITTNGFANVQSLSTADAWLVIFAFFLQLYFDFSGYVDMGVGSARMLGIHLPPNFNLPYVCATNLKEFWDRWHISLSAWLRDYIYIPLGGSRCSKLMTYRNILLTFTISGIWHGAAWHYVIWGFLHGVIVVATYIYLEAVKRSPKLTNFHAQKWTVPLAVIGTFITGALLQTMFRANNMTDCMTIYAHAFLPTAGSCDIAKQLLQSPALVSVPLYLIFGLIAVEVSWIPAQFLQPVREFFTTRAYRQAAFLIVALVAAIGFQPEIASPFIYFQF